MPSLVIEAGRPQADASRLVSDVVTADGPYSVWKSGQKPACSNDTVPL